METLAKLKESGCGLAIASSRRLASLCDYLDGLGIRDWFAYIVGADSVTKGKPTRACSNSVESIGMEGG